MRKINPEAVREKFIAAQANVISQLKASDPSVEEFSDEWLRPEGGGGRTCAFSEGKFIEKGGVNFSDVEGRNLPPSALANRPELTGAAFRAMGVSAVFHPLNPHAPTAHANIRFFSATEESGTDRWWFGGGFDLTPFYPVLEDVIFWHKEAKKLCDQYGEDFYCDFKKQCDQYFFLPHRQETRGVGGIFFDDFCLENFELTLEFTEKVIQVFSDSFFAILDRRKDRSFTEKEKEFQHYRRGRYAEFNLVYDRGTHFGLQSGGRTESILMSLPPRVTWSYNWNPKTNSKEADLYNNYLKPADWLGKQK